MRIKTLSGGTKDDPGLSDRADESGGVRMKRVGDLEFPPACGLVFGHVAVPPLAACGPRCSSPRSHFMVFADLLLKRDCLYHDIHEPFLPPRSRQR